LPMSLPRVLHCHFHKLDGHLALIAHMPVRHANIQALSLLSKMPVV
jgi:hypothetical protein